MKQNHLETYRRAVENRDTPALIAVAAHEAAQIGVDACGLLASVGSVQHIAISDWVDTACIEARGAVATIRFGTRFLRDQLQTPEDFLYILHHELMHLVLHIYSPFYRFFLPKEDLFRKGTWNMAADMQVSAILHCIWQKTPAIVCRNSSGKGLIHGLLNTPEALLNSTWRHDRNTLFEQEVYPALAERAQRKQFPVSKHDLAGLASIYCRVWSKDPPGIQELHETLMRHLTALKNDVCERPDEFAVAQPHHDLDPNDPDTRRALLPKISKPLKKRIVAQLKTNCMRQAGPGGQSEWHNVDSLPNEDVIAQIERLLRRAFAVEQIPSPRLRPDGQIGNPLFLTRKELLWLAAGHLPVLYPNRQQQAQSRPRPLSVYIDVSGSTMHDWRNFLEAARRAFRHRRISPFLFSTVVTEFNPAAQRPPSGVHSTLGTDFTCVMRHALGHSENWGNDILVLTDGFADVERIYVKKASRKRMAVQFILVHDDCPDTKVRQNLNKAFGPCLGRPGMLDVQGSLALPLV